MPGTHALPVPEHNRYETLTVKSEQDMRKRSKRKSKPSTTRQVILNKKLREAFIHFLEYHPAKRLSKNLRRILLEYLRHQDVGVSIYFEETVKDLEGLFDLLDVAEDEWKTNPLN